MLAYWCVFSCSVVPNPLWPLWTVACHAPLSVGFSRQEYWSGLPFLSPGDLPDPGIKPASPALQAYSLLLSHWRSPNKEWGTQKDFCAKEPHRVLLSYKTGRTSHIFRGLIFVITQPPERREAGDWVQSHGQWFNKSNILDSTDISLRKPREIVKDKESWN